MGNVQMKKLQISIFLILILSLLLSCGESQLFTAVPNDLNKNTVPKDTIEVIAKDFDFIPDTIRVHQGKLVTLEIKSIEGTHGFNLGAFGIDERLDENVTKIVEFYAVEKGQYGFRCSHLCGIGHFGMTGLLIIE
jgi:heme/copper-type cytochrome/quinol oxidase subunit 2